MRSSCCAVVFGLHLLKTFNLIGSSGINIIIASFTLGCLSVFFFVVFFNNPIRSPKWRQIYICYSPAGRAVLGKTVPEVSYSRQRAQFFPIRPDQGR